MKLTLLGTGNFLPYRAVGSAGYCVEAGSTTMMLDFGRGNLMNLAKAGINWQQITGIAVSHVHPDHISDMFQYLQAWTVTHASGEMDNDLTIYGPRGFQAFFNHYRTVLVTNWDKMPNIVELYDQSFEHEELRIKTAPMEHSIDASGYRIEADGKVLCYTGDTGFNENLLKLAQDADLLLTECALLNKDQKKGHMRPTDIAQVANTANVKKVVLTHYPDDPTERKARLEEVQKEFSGDVILGEDGLEIQL